MKFSIKTGNPEKLRADCIVVGVFKGRKLSETAEIIDTATEQAISSVLASGDMDGNVGSTLVLNQLPAIQAKRVMLLGLGDDAALTIKQWRQGMQAVVRHMPAGVKTVSLLLTDINVNDQPINHKVAHMVEAMLDASYQVNSLKTNKPDTRLEKVQILVDKADNTSAESGLAQGAAIGAGVAFAKDLGNLPPNVCTPSYLGDQAKKMAKAYGFKTEVLDKAAIKKLGMGAFLGVAQGSDEPPKFIVMQHLKGKKSQKPVVLVGKGITFDTGGISLKPGADMDEMKYDMCGAASVFGTFKAIGEMNLPINAIALIPTCDNMPSGHATRPGDILTSMSGQTIEVLNTDAEGRLILCDALTYAERFEPSAVVDVATLTGACVIALGQHASGLYSNQDALAQELLAAGEQAQDRAWHMPLWDEYQPQLDSNFADIANIGGRPAGSITAACFLSRFTKQYDWAHLDIAGTAWKSGKAKGGTGRPVSLLTTFLLKRVNVE